MRIPHIPASDKAFKNFTRLNSIATHSVVPVHVGGDPIDRGTILQCTADIDPVLPPPPPPLLPPQLLTLDRSVLLTVESVDIAAKSDHVLASALAAAGTLAQTLRGKVMVYLIVRMSTSAGLGIGTHDAWSEYVKFLPGEVLVPTTWTEEERLLLTGTSLETAVKAKLSALESEFNTFRNATLELSWAQKAWWSSVPENLTALDWLLVDSWYRSRAVQLPGPIGAAMAPVLDFANHSREANAYYVLDDDEGQGAISLRPFHRIARGEEVTINYAHGQKSAAEMVFSYGICDVDAAGEMRLSIECQPDDPLRMAKEMAYRGHPNVKITDDVDRVVAWESEFVWLAVVNEEDGLAFHVLQEITGKRTLQVCWAGEEIHDVSRISEHLQRSEMWPVYRLRAVVMICSRLEGSLDELKESEDACERLLEMGLIRDQPWEVASELRKLERDFMERSLQALEKERDELLGDPVVTVYMGKVQGLDANPSDEPDLS